MVAVDEALDRLSALNERQAEVMTLRSSGGMIVAEVAAAPGSGSRWRGTGDSPGPGFAASFLERRTNDTRTLAPDR